MEETKRRFPLSVFEVVLAIILVPVVFYCILKLPDPFFEKVFWEPLFSLVGFDVDVIWVFILILGFDLLWIIAMFLIPKYLRFRIYSTLFVLTVSFAILTVVFAMWSLGQAMH